MTEAYDYFQQGRAHLKDGMAAQATVALEKAKKLEPDKASIREALGIAYFRIQRWKEAEAEFRAVLELSPTDDYAHYALGRALEKQGRDAEANGHYKLASSLSPNSEHYAERIMELDRSDEPGEERDRLGHALAGDPANFCERRDAREREADPVLAHRRHPALDRGGEDLLGRALDQAADLAADRHHLEEPDAPRVARERAGLAAGRTVEPGACCRTRTMGRPSVCELALVGHVRLAAVLAELAREPLRDDAVERGRDQAGVDAHVLEPRDRAGGVLGVERAEHHVPGHRGLEGDVGRLFVADLADEDHVGVGAEDRAEAAGERQAGPRVDLDLVGVRAPGTRPGPRSS